MDTIEKEIEKINQIKIDLLKMSQCIEKCAEPQKELYQNICIEYSRELKKIKKSIEAIYNVSICEC